jgi:hypothetical protein
MSDDTFNSQNNDKVVNIKTNHGPVNINRAPSSENKQTSGSNSPIILAIFLGFLLVFSVIILIIFNSKDKAVVPNNSDISNRNFQFNGTIQNTNFNETIPDQKILQNTFQENPDYNENTPPKVVKNSNQTDSVLPSRKNKTTNKLKPNVTPSDCSATNEGC